MAGNPSLVRLGGFRILQVPSSVFNGSSLFSKLSHVIVRP